MTKDNDLPSKSHSHITQDGDPLEELGDICPECLNCAVTQQNLLTVTTYNFGDIEKSVCERSFPEFESAPSTI